MCECDDETRTNAEEGLQVATEYVIALKARHRQERAILLSALRQAYELLLVHGVTGTQVQEFKELIECAELWGSEPIPDPRAGQ